MNRDGLIRALIPLAERVFAPTTIFLAYAHGSRISGSPREDSDLDVGYYLRDYVNGASLGIRDEMLLEDELSRELGVEVDLRNLGPAPLELRGRVLEDGVRIYSSDEVRRVNLERDLLGRHHDYKEKWRRLHDERLCRIAEAGL